MKKKPSWSPVENQSHTLEQNWLFHLRKETHRSNSSGKTHDYYVLHLADVVNVIVVTPEDQVVLVRQFRAGSKKDSLETPGGLVDHGEDPLVAAVREVLEETGYGGDPASLIGTVWTNPSLLTSKASFVLIRNAQLITQPKLDHCEELEVELHPASRIRELIRSGQIDHSLTVAALLWWLDLENPHA